jgi:Ca2+-binding EF-hand superfamily protein
LKAQGFTGASKVSFFGGSDSTEPAKTSSNYKDEVLRKMVANPQHLHELPKPPPSPTRREDAAGVPRSGGAFTSSIGSLLLGGSDEPTPARQAPPAPVRTQIFSGNEMAVYKNAVNVDISNEMPYGISKLVDQMREQLKLHGAHGFHGVQRKFRIMDDDNSGKLSLGEFKKGISELSLNFTDGEMRMIFEHFDRYGTGEVSFENFLQSLRSPMSASRAALVKLAFDQLDGDGNGVLDPTELMDKYDASMHPDVIAGKKTETEVLREWLSVFEVGGHVDGKVTLEEWNNYYHNLSANIDNDDYFELMIRNAWHISGGEGQAANSTNRRVLVTNTDGSTSVMEVENDLGIKSTDGDKIMKKIKAKDAHAATINLFGSVEDQPEQRPMRKGIAGRRYVEPKVDAYKSTIAPVASAAALAGEVPPPLSAPTSKSPPAKPLPLGAMAQMLNRGVSSIIRDLRGELAKRGARGIVGLSRKFKIMDDNGDGSLSREEFSKAMKECDINLTQAEFDALFKYFDKDNSRDIDFEEFLQGLKGPMSDRRIDLIKQAFDVLDKDKSGVVEPKEIMDAYDTSKHPDVISGKKTRTEVLREFLETFEVGGEVDGYVSTHIPL